MNNTTHKWKKSGHFSLSQDYCFYIKPIAEKRNTRGEMNSER